MTQVAGHPIRDPHTVQYDRGGFYWRLDEGDDVVSHPTPPLHCHV